jgi:hypothetical protein
MDDNAQSERGDEEDETVTAQFPRAALSRFPSLNPLPPPEPFPHSPTASVFSVPNAIHAYSSSTPLVYGSNLPCFPFFAPSPTIQKEQESRRLRKKSHPRPEETELIDMAEQYSFSDGKGPTRNDVECVFYG